MCSQIFINECKIHKAYIVLLPQLLTTLSEIKKGITPFFILFHQIYFTYLSGVHCKMSAHECMLDWSVLKTMYISTKTYEKNGAFKKFEFQFKN